MDKFFKDVDNLLKNFSFTNFIDILLISLVVFLTFKFLIKNNSVTLIKVFIILVLSAIIINILGLGVSNSIIKFIFVSCYLAIIIIYSAEIKRAIWSKKHKLNFDKFSEQSCTDENLKVSTEEIVKAVQNMAKKDIGALIVFVTNQPPAGIIESGVVLNGIISSQLVESIFIPKSPLHDGAVLIKDNKILAAGCFLPLSLEINLPKEFGTRHRAAIGITEQHNVMAIVVSEETGIISIAKNGQLKRYIDGEMLKSAIENVYGLSSKVDSRWHKKRG